MAVEALLSAQNARVGAESPAALLVSDLFLVRELWMTHVHPGFAVAAEVWGWGDNSGGELGLGDRDRRPTPTEITALRGKRVKDCVCGHAHTLVRTEDGELWATGTNGSGQLGLGDATEFVASLQPVASLRRVACVAAAGWHSMALLDTGELFAFGYNRFGQLGVDDTDNRARPTQVAALSGKRVVSVVCGSSFTVATTDSGLVYSWGCNNNGQLGLGMLNDQHTPQTVMSLA